MDLTGVQSPQMDWEAENVPERCVEPDGTHVQWSAHHKSVVTVIC